MAHVKRKNRSDGDRYKTGSYPAIRQIAHALSLDEKRSMFQPIPACLPIDNATSTKIDEQWFPGAHADVGGGYDNQHPGVSSYNQPDLESGKSSSITLAEWERQLDAMDDRA